MSREIATFLVVALAFALAMVAFVSLRASVRLRSQRELWRDRARLAKLDADRNYVYQWAAMGELDNNGRIRALNLAECELKKQGLWDVAKCQITWPPS